MEQNSTQQYMKQMKIHENVAYLDVYFLLISQSDVGQVASLGLTLPGGDSGIQAPSILWCCHLHMVSKISGEEGERMNDCKGIHSSVVLQFCPYPLARHGSITTPEGMGNVVFLYAQDKEMRSVSIQPVSLPILQFIRIKKFCLLSFCLFNFK